MVNQLRYNKIIDYLKKQPSSIPQIKKKLFGDNLGVSKSLIKRDYIDKMVKEMIIGSLDKSKKTEYKEIFKQITMKDWDNRTNLIYFHTPHSEKLHKTLTNLIQDLSNKSQSQELIFTILRHFRSLEIFSQYKKEQLFDDKVIKKVLRKQGIKPTKENIKKEKDYNLKVIMPSPEKQIKINLPIKDFIKEIDREKYIPIGGRMVNIKCLENFLDLIKNNMSHIMFWCSIQYHFEEKNIQSFLLDKMFILFIEIEKESQIKI